MRYLIGTIAGSTLTLLAIRYTHTRHWQRILWWAATRDVRHNDPHLYGWGRG